LLAYNLHQLNSGLQLAWAAVKVRSGSADAAMTSERFQDVYRGAFVRKVC
jgi:hypothetical protein